MDTDCLSFFVIDVETPNRNNDRISSFAYAVVQDRRIVESGHTLVNPEVEFDPFNSRLTGIDSSMVQNAPTFPEVWAALSDRMKDSVVVAHSAPFDLSVLRKCLTHYQIPSPNLRYLCTFAASRELFPQLPNHKLNTLCDYFGIPLNHHQAESDVEACATILQMLLCSDSFQPAQFISRFDMRPERDRWRQMKHRKLSSTTRSLQQLRALIQSITEDNVLTDDEIELLSEWMDNNTQLQGNYPYDRIYTTLHDILNHGAVEQAQSDQLLSLLKDAVDPVQAQACEASPNTDLAGKHICLTGEFDRASRAQVEKELAGLGADIQKNVTKQTQIVLVGNQGSEAWVCENYGRKVKKALEYQRKGINIQIIREQDFFSAIFACT